MVAVKKASDKKVSIAATVKAAKAKKVVPSVKAVPVKKPRVVVSKRSKDLIALATKAVITPTVVSGKYQYSTTVTKGRGKPVMLGEVYDSITTLKKALKRYNAAIEIKQVMIA